MFTELIRAVNHFTCNFKQPIKLEILSIGASVDVDSDYCWIYEDMWLCLLCCLLSILLMLTACCQYGLS